jgi:DNA-binding winged helix-turn-helix (wHTH) protein/TolB-like protein
MPPALRFDRFAFHPQSGELVAPGKTVRLEPQPAKVLAILASRPGEVVTREELQREVWPADVFVDFEAGLGYCIRAIRRALEDSAVAPRFIETLPKRGYRFLAGPVADTQATLEPDGAPQPKAEPPAAAARQPGGRRVALAVAVLGLLTGLIVLAVLIARIHGGAALPATQPPTLAVTLFDNQTGNPDLDRAAQILTDTVVERLAQDPTRWSVIGNAAMLRLPRPERNLATIGSALHADFVVLGQIEPAAHGVIILTHLIRARDQRHLWVGRFELPAAVPPGAAERIAASVARAAAARLAGAS